MSSVLAETSLSKKLGKKKLHQMVDTESHSTFKRLKVDTIPNFSKNCGPFVGENNGSKFQQHDVLVNHRLKVPKNSPIYTGNRCDWFSSGGRIINGSELFAISGHELLTEYEHIQKQKQVRETLKLFDDKYIELLQEDKAEKHGGRSRSRIDIKAAMILRYQMKWVNCEWAFGHVPGVEIGDQFRFRAELSMVGLHHQLIRGIHYVNINRKDVAISIVDSGRYENETISSETFIYVGQGGNPKVSENSRVEDQKLERDNLALKNSMDLGYSVRVICGRPRVNGEKTDAKYIYNGLYTVTKCWQERGPTGKYIFKFEMQRNVGQPKLAQFVKVNHIHENVNKATKSIMQSEFVIDRDISQGKEKIPILVINAIDDERPPPFTYITNMQCPNWYQDCKNRVSQYGPRYPFEVFKTKSKGWGLRSVDHIAPRSFICEYIGELLDQKEAKIRMDYDEYFFDVGKTNEYIPKSNVANNKVKSNSFKRKDEEGFTADAAIYGNVGRFINHSCSPNLYVKNVMYDHGDKRVPHIMFFASKSISPLEELTYHYNHRIVHVKDTNGNFKREKGRCGSRKCEGRM